MRQWIMLLIVAFVLSTTAGCGLFAPKAPDVDRPYSGFMNDYQPLSAVEVDEREFIAAKAWIAPDSDLRSYKTMIVDPIELDKGIQQDIQITKDAMTAIRSYMTTALTHKLEEYYRVSDHENGRTLRAKVAITGLETRDEPLRFYEYWPSAMALTGMAMLVGIRDEDIHLFVEAEFVDAATDHVVAKTLVGMVGHERLENEWEAVSLDKLSTSIDQWIEHQVTALKQAAQENVIVSSTQE